jgi:hypothetical protein
MSRRRDADAHEEAAMNIQIWQPVGGTPNARARARRRGAEIRIAALAAGVLALGIPALASAQFPDAFNAPPAGWTGPVFKLSQAYPATQPALEPQSQRRWVQFDFKNPAQAAQYMQAVLDYCLEGNTADNFADVSANSVRKWYHAPWLHSTASGREFIHGMTKERPSRAGELGPAQTTQRDNWAVGFYNARGAYTIGRVWKNPTQPDPRLAKFPSHTVTCKLLFTTAPLTEVPFLDGSLEWEGDINRQSGSGPRPKVRLLQLDIAVKDPRANSTTGWVFGTFQYEKAASASPNWWEHLVPVGLMWGSDVARLKANQPTQQDWINANRGQKLHLGRKDLVLNGPIDNPLGSCTSCHGFAQVARVNNPAPALPRNPPALNASGTALDRYFTNIKAATPLSADYVSVDYALQLQIGIKRALDAGASLPPGLNMIAHAAGAPRPVATSIPEVTRGEE